LAAKRAQDKAPEQKTICSHDAITPIMNTKVPDQ